MEILQGTTRNGIFIGYPCLYNQPTWTISVWRYFWATVELKQLWDHLISKRGGFPLLVRLLRVSFFFFRMRFPILVRQLLISQCPLLLLSSPDLASIHHVMFCSKFWLNDILLGILICDEGFYFWFPSISGKIYYSNTSGYDKYWKQFHEEFTHVIMIMIKLLMHLYNTSHEC